MTIPADPDLATSHRGGSRAEQAIAALAEQPAARWLEAARTLVLEHDPASAQAVLRAACARFADDAELHHALAGVLWQCGDLAAARECFESLLARHPDHAGASFALARLQAEQGDFAAAETTFLDLFRHSTQPVDLVMRAAKMLAEWNRKPAAAEVCATAIAAGCADPMLHLYAAALFGQLGDFERARRGYLFALEHEPRAIAFGAAYGLASIERYRDPAHADGARFAAWLQRDDLDAEARASLLFASGKFHDDLGDFETAARCWREGNALVDRRGFSRRDWRRLVESRLGARPLPRRTPAADECVPIFVVGAPRSGTTLVAELLGRSPLVRNRGELDWLPHFAEQVAKAARVDAALLDGIAQAYLSKLRQDEREARWFVDKQPLNFLHVDLARALFPQARFVYCRRSARDIALSLWSQHFGSSEYRFAYDFDDIAAFLQGVSRLMAKARRDAPSQVIEVRYENLVQQPQATVDAMAAALGLPAFDCSAPEQRPHAIGTASLWQARQPVYTRAVGRWRAYAEFLPELSRFADD